jgi:hypothetical protein
LPPALAKPKDPRRYLPHRATIFSPYSPECVEG